MRTTIAVALLLSSTLTASADAIFCINATPSGGAKQESCWSIPDAALGDLLTVYGLQFFRDGLVHVSPAATNADGTVTPEVTRPVTPQDILAALGSGLQKQILSSVMDFKRTQAAAAAAQAVPEIVVTPQ